MKTFDLFVVELEKQINDTIKTSSGLELYVDNRFNEFKHRVNAGPLVAVPFKYDTGAQPGDTLFFHHLVVLNEGQVLTGHEDHYLVRYCDPSISVVNNQAIAYKSKDTGEVHPLGGWVMLSPFEEEQKPESEVIEVVKLKEDPVTKGIVSFESEKTKELGLEVGDVVGFKKNMDYRFKIDDVEYYRVDYTDIYYVEEEVHNG